MPVRTEIGRVSRRVRTRGGRGGLTLVEVVVAIAVLVGIGLGLYALLDSSNWLAKQETNVSEAQQSARVGIYEVSRMIRQARTGQLYYGNAILPVANNSPGGTSLVDLSGGAHYIRKGTDVIGVRGIMLGDRYAMTSGDVNCGGSCSTSTTMSVTIRATAGTGVVNYPTGGKPSLASRTRPFFFVVSDGSTQPIDVAGKSYLIPLYYVGRVETAGNWYTQTSDTFTFTMNPQDVGAQKFNATSSGAPALEKPYSGGAVDEVLFFVDEGPTNQTGGTTDSHPSLGMAVYDPSSDRYDIQPLVAEVEDFQVAYGVDGVSGVAPDRGISPASVDLSAANTDEWVGNVASEIQTTLPISATEPRRVDAFLDTSIPSGPPNPSLATPALRSVWLSLVVKSAEPDIRYSGPGATGIQVLDSTAIPFSSASATGRPYRRRLQSIAVALRNYQ